MEKNNPRRRLRPTPELTPIRPPPTIRLELVPARTQQREDLALDIATLNPGRVFAAQAQAELVRVRRVLVRVEPLAQHELGYGKVHRFVEGVAAAVVDEGLEGGMGVDGGLV